jgi:hypothetical protein
VGWGGVWWGGGGGKSGQLPRKSVGELRRERTKTDKSRPVALSIKATQAAVLI